MPFAQDVTTDPNYNVTGNIINPASKDGTYTRTGGGGASNGQPIQVLGHTQFSLQTKQVGAAAIVVKLQGSNDGANWVDLITNNNAGNDTQFGVAVDKPYRFVRVARTTDGAGTSDYYLRCAGASGIY